MSDDDKKISERLQDFSRACRNKIWQQGGIAALREFETKLRTCLWCGHVADEEGAECPVCGHIRIGKPEDVR